jgi:hypothetical protein
VASADVVLRGGAHARSVPDRVAIVGDRRTLLTYRPAGPGAAGLGGSSGRFKPGALTARPTLWNAIGSGRLGAPPCPAGPTGEAAGPRWSVSTHLTCSWRRAARV